MTYSLSNNCTKNYYNRTLTVQVIIEDVVTWIFLRHSVLAVLVAGATAMQNSPFSSLSVAVTIASTHCAYPRRDGQAELAWMAGYVVR